MTYLEKLNTDKSVKNLIKFYSKDFNRENQLYFHESKHFMKKLSNYIP